MKVTIDLARPPDVMEIVRIEREAFSDPWSARSFREALDPILGC